MNKEFILKKNILGGFDRHQVIDYLLQLQAKCSDSQTQEEAERLKQQIDSFHKKIDEKNKKINTLKAELDSINKLGEAPANDTFKALEEADKIISSAKKEVEVHIQNANESVRENNEKFTQLMNRVNSLKAELTQIGSKADGISSKLNKIEIIETEDIPDPAADETFIEDCIAEEIPAQESDDYPDFSEDAEEFIINEPDENYDEDFNSGNSIDNFFAELEKLTGSSDFYDNGPDIDEAFDRSKRILPDDNNEKKDEAFDDMLKNIFHESSDK